MFGCETKDITEALQFYKQDKYNGSNKKDKRYAKPTTKFARWQKTVFWHSILSNMYVWIYLPKPGRWIPSLQILSSKLYFSIIFCRVCRLDQTSLIFIQYSHKILLSFMLNAVYIKLLRTPSSKMPLSKTEFCFKEVFKKRSHE